MLGIVDGPITEAPSDYAIEPKPGLYIETEGPFRYVNHSCLPSVELIGERVVVALRPIRTGEELFFDYSTFIYDNWSMPCECGNINCRKIINNGTTVH